MMLATMDGGDFPHPTNTNIVKNTTHKRLVRLTHLSKKGHPGKPKGLGKNQGYMQKIVHRQVENPKGRLGQKRVFWWAENLKGRSRKKLRIKSV